MWHLQPEPVHSGRGVAGCLPAHSPPSPPPLVQSFFAPTRATAPLAVLDLADEGSSSSSSSGGNTGAWTLSVDGAPPRPILVPGGGFSSDQQAQPWIAQTAVAAAVVYRRALTAPARPAHSILRLSFGAVNYGARITLNGQQVGLHLGPMMPFEVDVTAAVDAAGGAGAALTLAVEAWPYHALAGAAPSSFLYDEAWSNATQPPGWASRACAGICRHVRLLTLPALRLQQVRTAAACGPPATLSVLATLVNDSPLAIAPGTLTLTPALSSYTAAPWVYPSVPVLTLPAAPLLPGGSVEVPLTIDWSTLPPDSWWWPNRPFSPNYTAQLHWLNFTLGGMGAPSGEAVTSATRFGFVQHNSAIYYWTLNGLRINHLSDATPENGMSYYDAYSSPASYWSQNPQDVWRRYMAVGMTSNRIHQSTPTEALLAAADEVGFLLKPESPVRGACNYAPCPAASSNTTALFAQSVGELAGACRGHPSVFAYSVENESPAAVGGHALIGALLDAAYAADSSVPATTEGSGSAPSYPGASPGTPPAVNLLHYAQPDSSRSHIRGVGECAWCVQDGLEQYAALAVAGRLADVAYTAGWDWFNYWSNFLPGHSAARHAWKQAGCAGRDRTDGLDGWGSPVLRWVQLAFHSFLPMDLAAYAANPAFTPNWPASVPTLRPGQAHNRSVAVFNDVLRGDLAPWAPAAAQRLLQWSAHWDSVASQPVLQGQLPVTVQPGFHELVGVDFTVPAPTPPGQLRQLFIRLVNSAQAGSSAEDGVEDRVYVMVQG